MNIRGTFNTETQKFIIETLTTFPKELQLDISNMERVSWKTRKKSFIPKTGHNLGILISLGGIQWDNLAYEHLYSDLAIENPLNLTNLKEKLFRNPKDFIRNFTPNGIYNMRHRKQGTSIGVRGLVRNPKPTNYKEICENIEGYGSRLRNLRSLNDKIILDFSLCPLFNIFTKKFWSDEKNILKLWKDNKIHKPKETCSKFVNDCIGCISDKFSLYTKQKTWVDCSTFLSLYSMKFFNLKNPLYPFQFEDALKIDKWKGRGLITSEMGTGKTAVSLAWAQAQNKRVLVICPSTVKYNWEKEIKKWTIKNNNTFIMNGKKPEDLPNNLNYIIINYDIVKDRIEELEKFNPEIIIVDEFHKIKESKTLRTKAVKKICKGKRHIIGLSGTPITSRPIEFFNMLNIVVPMMFNNYWSFAKHYCDAKQNRYGWNTKGSSNEEELNLILTEVMIRRLKKDVLTELPDKTRTLVPMDIDNKGEYNRANRDLLSFLKQRDGEEKANRASRAEELVKKGILKQLAIKGKIKQSVEWIKDFLDENLDQKIIVFAIHKSTVDELYGQFNKVAVKIDGSTPSNKRLDIVEEFQTNPEKRVFIGNIKASGTGITLTASSTVCFVELDYLPTDFLQAEDRPHRIGQKSAVNIYYFVGKNTIDEEIMKILSAKMEILNKVVDGTDEEKENIFQNLVDKI
jgi:SWI/SNF-related matrix-associated actin-dependent regulator 1 of chromatin subfamily A